MDHVLIAPYNDTDALGDIRESTNEHVAAAVEKPKFGSHGFVNATTEYLQAVQKFTVAYWALFKLDEVQTLRLNTGGAHQLYGISPELTPHGQDYGRRSASRQSWRPRGDHGSL